MLLGACSAGCRLPGVEGPVSKSLATSRQYSQQGVAAIEAGRWAEAQELLAKAVKCCPADPEAPLRIAKCCVVVNEMVPESIIAEPDQWDDAATYKPNGCGDHRWCGIHSGFDHKRVAGEAVAVDDAVLRAARHWFDNHRVDGMWKAPGFHAGFVDYTAPADLSKNLGQLALAAVDEEQQIAEEAGCVDADGHVLLPLPRELRGLANRPALRAYRAALSAFCAAAYDALCATVGGRVPARFAVHVCGESDPLRPHFHAHGRFLPFVVDGQFERADKAAGTPVRLLDGTLRTIRAHWGDLGEARAHWRAALRQRHAFRAYVPDDRDVVLYYQWVEDRVGPQAHRKCEHEDTADARRVCAVNSRLRTPAVDNEAPVSCMQR